VTSEGHRLTERPKRGTLVPGFRLLSRCPRGMNPDQTYGVARRIGAMAPLQLDLTEALNWIATPGQAQVVPGAKGTETAWVKAEARRRPAAALANAEAELRAAL
jgi:hypothetical protein